MTERKDEEKKTSKTETEKNNKMSSCHTKCQKKWSNSKQKNENKQKIQR